MAIWILIKTPLTFSNEFFICLWMVGLPPPLIEYRKVYKTMLYHYD